MIYQYLLYVIVRPDLMVASLTNSPVCGAWMYLPLPLQIQTCVAGTLKQITSPACPEPDLPPLWMSFATRGVEIPHCL